MGSRLRSMSTAGTRKLVILDVGHGNAAVLHDDHGVVVIDTAPGSALLEYLDQEGIQRIDTVLVSHADHDHIGGLVGLLAADITEVGRVVLNSDSLKDTGTWASLLQELDRRHGHDGFDVVLSLIRDKTGRFDQGSISVEVLGPGPYLAGRGPGAKDRQGRRIATNSVSAVIRLSRDGEPIALLPGDLDEIGLDELILSGEDLRAPLLVFPHHGGLPRAGDSRGFTRRLCELVSPKTVIFSIGRGRHSTPRPEVIEEVRTAVPGVRIACTQLSDHCSASVPAQDPPHLNPEFSLGRSQRHCCAGSLVLGLDRSLSLLPLAEDHYDFISSAAPSALCRRS